MRRPSVPEPGSRWGLPDPERAVHAPLLRSDRACSGDAQSACRHAYGHREHPRCREALRHDLAVYLPLVQRLVRKVARRLPANVQRDDLLAAGVCGLMDSLRKNRGDGGAAFAWYARVRIRGAIFDELRAQDWLSRRVRDRLGGSAAACFVSFDDVAVSEDELAGDDDPAAQVEASSERRALAAALAQLPERDRLVVARHYLDGARLKEIGAELGLSEPRISQILTRALAKLRTLLLAEAA